MQLSVYKHLNHIRLKLKNFEPKISLCVQLAVLSDKKCKYWDFNIRDLHLLLRSDPQ